MRHRLYVHITWTTRHRDRTIGPEAAAILRRLLPAIARQERASVLEVGIVRTHVHLLVQLHPTTPIPRLMQRLKGGSSVIVNRECGSTATNTLRWAKGYNIESVSVRSVTRVRAYVRNQAARHPNQAIPAEHQDPLLVASATDFEARGMGPFRPYGEDGEAMQYYQLPEDLLEDAEGLGPWVDKAIDVARRKGRRRSKRGRGK